MVSSCSKKYRTISAKINDNRPVSFGRLKIEFTTEFFQMLGFIAITRIFINEVIIRISAMISIGVNVILFSLFFSKVFVLYKCF